MGLIRDLSPKDKDFPPKIPPSHLTVTRQTAIEGNAQTTSPNTPSPHVSLTIAEKGRKYVQ